jgi:cytochrome c-type biogenesis protein CcmH
MRAFIAALMMTWSFAAGAGEAQALYADQASDARLSTLATELRCLVCQNQTIADSHSELAADLRRQILDQIAAGKTDQEIVDFMVARYGDFVLYRPPLKPTTVLLWLGPFLLLALAAIALFRYFRRPGTEEEE